MAKGTHGHSALHNLLLLDFIELSSIHEVNSAVITTCDFQEWLTWWMTLGLHQMDSENRNPNASGVEVCYCTFLWPLAYFPSSRGETAESVAEMMYSVMRRIVVREDLLQKTCLAETDIAMNSSGHVQLTQRLQTVPGYLRNQEKVPEGTRKTGGTATPNHCSWKEPVLPWDTQSCRAE